MQHYFGVAFFAPASRFRLLQSGFRDLLHSITDDALARAEQQADNREKAEPREDDKSPAYRAGVALCPRLFDDGEMRARLRAL